ncbi:hypothetical protein EFR63_02925 [Lactobacillus delbrueckii subsp. lactis]|nr:hypothetical protein [Lactobacillus delbrueckii subsp. lactis]
MPSSPVFRYPNKGVTALTSAGTEAPLLQLHGKTLANPRVQPTRMTKARALAINFPFFNIYSA